MLFQTNHLHLASGNAWSGYTNDPDPTVPDADGNAMCPQCYETRRAETITPCPCCDWTMCSACRKKHSKATSWQSGNVQWRQNPGGWSGSGGSDSTSWDRGSGSQSSNVKSEKRGTATVKWKWASNQTCVGCKMKVPTTTTVKCDCCDVMLCVGCRKEHSKPKPNWTTVSRG